MPERPVRVTHVTFDLDGGGLESLIRMLVTHFAGTPVRMSAVTLSGRPGRIGAAIAPSLEQFHVVPKPGRWSLAMLFPIAVARAIRKTRPDVVHLHSGVWFKGALAARMAGVKRVIYTEHGREHFDPPLLRFIDRRARLMTDVVVTVSSRLERYVQEHLGVRPDRVVTIENAVDTSHFTPGGAPAALRQRLGIPADALVLGSVGRLETVKGYDRLLGVFAALRARGDIGRPVYLVVVGEGKKRAILEQKAAELGVAEWVRFPGWMEQPVDAYRLLDVFALTSRSEGLSVSLLEALACGAAPVVNTVGANAEIVGAELAHQVVAEGDWDRFADVVADTLRDPERRAHAAALGRARVEAHYSLDRLADRYLDIYTGTARADRD